MLNSEKRKLFHDYYLLKKLHTLCRNPDNKFVKLCKIVVSDSLLRKGFFP